MLEQAYVAVAIWLELFSFCILSYLLMENYPIGASSCFCKEK